MPPDDKNVLGGTLSPCSMSPRTGFYRDGCCNTGPEDLGLHVVCVQVTEEFLAFARGRGNDLITPAPEFGFPGLQSGDRWCVCAATWREAFAAGVAECDVETKARKSYRGYRFGRTDPAIVLAAQALERCGYEVTYDRSGGAADANVFNERGLTGVNLANGMTNIHTPDEHIAVDDLEAMVDVTLALLDVARAA